MTCRPAVKRKEAPWLRAVDGRVTHVLGTRKAGVLACGRVIGS